MMNFKDMMQQAQQMQFKLQEMQEKLKDIDVEGQAGAGMVKATISCAGVVRGVEIDPSVIDANDKETLEDLVTAALNNAHENKEQRIKDETQAMMEAMGLPPGTKLPI